MMQWLLPIAGWARRIARTALATVPIAGACLVLAGCKQPPAGEPRASWTDVFKPRPPLTVTTAPATPDADANSAGLRPSPVATLMLTFDVLRTQAPRGTFSESGKIWNHVDEQVVPAELAVTLNRNGLRIARGKLASWAPIKALLDTEKDVTSQQNAMTLNNGMPLTVELDAQPHDQTLFLLRADGSMPGATLPGSMNLLRIEYAIPVTSPDSVLVEVMPEIRLQPQEATQRPDVWAPRPAVPRTRVFRELAVRMLIGPDEFLAIGPSQAIQRAYTLGSLLLGREIDGRPYESMFFITPRVVRKTLAGTPGDGTVRPAGAPTGR